MVNALEPDGAGIFTVVTTRGVCTPTRVPQGVLNAIKLLAGYDGQRFGLDGLLRKTLRSLGGRYPAVDGTGSAQGTRNIRRGP